MNFSEDEIIDHIILSLNNNNQRNEENIINTVEIFSKLSDFDNNKILELINIIKEKYNIVVDNGLIIKDSNHVPWYINFSANNPCKYYWDRFYNYSIKNKKLPINIVSHLDNVTNEIMDLLGNPNIDGSWKRRGLLIGDVQSGKTLNYTAISNKAADAGYKIIILLTGTTETLRKQTQYRIEEGFVGRSTQNGLNYNSDKVGVGEYNDKRSCIPLTSIKSDFKKEALNYSNFDLNNINEPAIFVIKKNSNVLKTLIKWLKNSIGSNGYIEQPLLLIDDESDNASINTNPLDNSPTLINSHIREILSFFTKTSYIGVTATPFANIFIDSESYDDSLKDDLFPKDFIYLLGKQSNYIGCEEIFGENSKYSSHIVNIDDSYNFFPFRHNRDYQVIGIPDSLKDAICYFLVCVVIKNDIKEHRTMLVNVSAYKNMHSQMCDYISEYINELKYSLSSYSYLPIEKAILNTDINRIINISNKNGIKIEDDFLKKANKIVSTIVVRKINSDRDAKDLDYTSYKDFGLNVIVVGGNALSRGLTLEGLCVSYFHRKSIAYDTLMQMGRWFGYRDRYLNQWRIWMNDEIKYLYEHISIAYNELKYQIEVMNKHNLTPKDFGLMIRKHPESLLIITARNKMRASASTNRSISISGKILDTPKLPIDDKLNIANYRLIVDFIKGLDLYDDNVRDSLVWYDVDNNDIIELLNNFNIINQNIMLNPIKPIVNYINSNDKLKKWDVVLFSGDSKPINLYGEINISPSLRIITMNEDKTAYCIGGSAVRLSGRVMQIGLSEDQIKNIKVNHPNSIVKKRIPDTAFLIENRKPIIVIYLLEPNLKSNIQKTNDYYFTGLSIGFPGGDPNKTIEYSINSIAFSDGVGIDNEYDDVED